MKKKKLSRRNRSTYFLDECIQIHWSNSIRLLTGDYELSVNKVGRSASDEKVLEYAMKHNQTLVTADLDLTLWSILKNHPVIFINRNGKRYLINGNSKKISSVKIIDRITKYLSEQDTIVIS